MFKLVSLETGSHVAGASRNNIQSYEMRMDWVQTENSFSVFVFVFFLALEMSTNHIPAQFQLFPNKAK